MGGAWAVDERIRRPHLNLIFCHEAKRKETIMKTLHETTPAGTPTLPGAARAGAVAGARKAEKPEGRIEIRPPAKYLAVLAYRLDWLHKHRDDCADDKTRCWYLNQEINALFWILNEYAALTETDVRAVLKRIGVKALRKRTMRERRKAGDSKAEAFAAAAELEPKREGGEIDLTHFDAFAEALAQWKEDQLARALYQAWTEMDPPKVRALVDSTMIKAGHAA